MGTPALWIAFHGVLAILLLSDLLLFHRRAREISWTEALFESLVWISLSVGFGLWIFSSRGPGAGLEFFTGYVIEKSLSVDNVFLFLLIFRYFHVERRYQHRLLYWGVVGALVLRGSLIGLGAALIARFEWTLYLFGAFLLFAGFKFFGADHSVKPEKNPVLDWAKKILPVSTHDAGGSLFVREGGRWLVTQLFLVVLVVETTDLIFAVDSIPAVFGVTRDPFLVYTSNVCAILGLRALYFLLAGILPYFLYLDKGLAVVLMFIGGKMLAAPWISISTGISLAVVGGVIGIAVVASFLKARTTARSSMELAEESPPETIPPFSADLIGQLAAADPVERAHAARLLYYHATMQIAWVLNGWRQNEAIERLLVLQRLERPNQDLIIHPRLTAGIAVQPDTFEKIRAANGSPALEDAPSDQDVLEFELTFPGKIVSEVRLDILTTRAPGGGGAIAKFLDKFGEGIQQVEIDVTDIDRMTEILRDKFGIQPVYPATRNGAGGTRVNFFLVPIWNGKKALIELVEHHK